MAYLIVELAEVRSPIPHIIQYPNTLLPALTHRFRDLNHPID